MGAFHSGLGASHFRAGASGYSERSYNPLNALLPDRLMRWIPHVARFWFRKEYPFRDYTSGDTATASTGSMTASPSAWPPTGAPEPTKRTWWRTAYANSIRT